MPVDCQVKKNSQLFHHKPHLTLLHQKPFTVFWSSVATCVGS